MSAKKNIMEEEGPHVVALFRSQEITDSGQTIPKLKTWWWDERRDDRKKEGVGTGIGDSYHTALCIARVHPKKKESLSLRNRKEGPLAMLTCEFRGVSVLYLVAKMVASARKQPSAT